MPNGSFKWLHLSDLHTGMFGQSWLWPNFRDVFFRDLRKMLPKLGGCDVVIFSGDLVYKGTREEYNEFDEIITSLWDCIRGCGYDPKFFVIPGNHDLSRPSSSKPEAVGLKRWFEEEDVRTNFFEKKGNDFRTFLSGSVFTEYLAWNDRPCVNDIDRISSSTGVLPGDCSAEVSFEGGSAGLVGLNSTWLQLDGSDYEERLHVDVRQLLPLTANDPANWTDKHAINLLVSHHPVAWHSKLSQSHWRSEIDIPGRFDAHIYGHMHEASSSSIAQGGSISRVAIQAPSLFGLEKIGDSIKDRIHGYYLCEIILDDDTKTFKIWPRKSEIGLAGDRKVVPNYGFTLDEQDACVLSIGEKKKVVEQPVATLARLKGDTLISTTDDLGNLRYSIYAPETHRMVRKAEQQVCSELLKRGRIIWLSASWGLGSDEFIACVQRLRFGIQLNTYRIDLSEYDDKLPIIDYLDSSVVKSFSSVCEALARKGSTFLIFDGVEKFDSRSLIPRLETFVEIIKDYCPACEIVLRTRVTPSRSRIPNITLRPLDEADCRAYILTHELGSSEYTTSAVVTRLFQHTDGIPSKLDTALKDLQVVGLSGMAGLNADFTSERLALPSPIGTLASALNSISGDRDASTKRSFQLLKFLALLPHGEQFLRIQRIEGSHPFHSSDAHLLLGKGLLEVSSADRFWNQESDAPARVLKVPRPVREAVRGKMSKREASLMNRKLADLYFGQSWSSGLLRQSPLFRFDNPARSSAEIVNANTIIIRLINEEATTQDNRLLGGAVRLASAHMTALIEGTHYRSAAAFHEEVYERLPNGFNDVSATMRMRYGKCLRMVGEHARAKAQLAAVKGDQPTKEAAQSVLINLALCHKALGDDEDAKVVLDEVLALNGRNNAALHAQAIKIELTEHGPERVSKLIKHEIICRRRKAHVVANNIALALARDRAIPEREAREMLANVLREAQTNSDHYNGVRAIVEFCRLRTSESNRLSDEERASLIMAYHVLFSERISSLFDQCHDLLWTYFERIGDVENLLVLFRQSSLIWRLRGAKGKESNYLSKLAASVGNRLPRFVQQAPLATAYYLSRASAIDSED